MANCRGLLMNIEALEFSSTVLCDREDMHSQNSVV